MKYYEVHFSIVEKPATVCVEDIFALTAALAGSVGFESFEEGEADVTGYIQQGLYDEDALKATFSSMPIEGVRLSWTVKEAEYKDWNEEWEREGFSPIIIGDRCVIHDGRHIPKTDLPVSVEIDAKQAFGTGSHETTRMVISALLDMDLRNKSVLDCGCGTGILGILALKAGATYALGYDIDEWSTENASHNAHINGVGDAYEVMLGDASLLDNVCGNFDVVLANINRNILLNDMPRFVQAMKDGGALVLSGFYVEDVPAISERAEVLGLEGRSVVNEGGWACLVFQYLKVHLAIE